MSNLQQLAERYIATWNESDPAARRELVGELWSEGGSYTDPLMAVTGHEEISAAIGAARAQFPGLVFTLGPVDAHHDLARFTWDLGPVGGEALIVGFDVLVAGPDGLVESVLGFLDHVPSS